MDTAPIFPWTLKKCVQNSVIVASHCATKKENAISPVPFSMVLKREMGCVCDRQSSRCKSDLQRICYYNVYTGPTCHNKQCGSLFNIFIEYKGNKHRAQIEACL